MSRAPKTTRVTTRTCVGCRRKAPCTELLRFTLDVSGALSIDYRGDAPGRGAWLCPLPSCLQQATRRNAFSRSFRRRVSYDPVTLPGEVSQGLSFRVEAAIRSARRAGALTQKRTCKLEAADETRASGLQEESTAVCGPKGTERALSWGNPPETWVITDVVWSERVARAIDRYLTWNSLMDTPSERSAHHRRNEKGS